MKAIDEYIEIVKEVREVYLDTDAAFLLALMSLKKIQKEKAQEINISKKEMDKLLFRQSKPGFDPISEKTQGEFKMHMEEGGKYRVFAANMYVITVYSYWEDHYREAIAEELELNNKYDLKSQIMGDIGKLRRSIIHHKAIALKDTEKCEILDWFKEGDPIEFNRENIVFITEQIQIGMEELKMEHL